MDVLDKVSHSRPFLKFLFREHYDRGAMIASSMQQPPAEKDAGAAYQSFMASPPPPRPADTHNGAHRSDQLTELDTAPDGLDVGFPPPQSAWQPPQGAWQPPQSTWQRILSEYRLLEFGSACVMYLLALVFALIDVHQRPIPAIRVRLNSTTTIWALDPAIDEPKLAEQVPMWALLSFGIGLPVGTNFVVNYVLPKVCHVRVIAHDTRDFLLSLLQSVALATLLTQFTKSITGRFRPSFYDMCKWDHSVVWDGVTNLCTDAAGEKEGRKSFPSGHASFAWSSMLVLTIYLLGRSRLNCENRSSSMLRGGKKSLLLFVSCAPTLLAAWVSISRCIDNWHHYSDILAGSVIGAVSASFAMNYNYGSIFSWDTAGVPLEEIHERRIMKAKKDEQNNYLQQQQPPTLHNFGDSRRLFKCMSSDYIVDFSNRDSTPIVP